MGIILDAMHGDDEPEVALPDRGDDSAPSVDAPVSDEKLIGNAPSDEGMQEHLALLTALKEQSLRDLVGASRCGGNAADPGPFMALKRSANDSGYDTDLGMSVRLPADYVDPDPGMAIAKLPTMIGSSQGDYTVLSNPLGAAEKLGDGGGEDGAVETNALGVVPEHLGNSDEAASASDADLPPEGTQERLYADRALIAKIETYRGESASDAQLKALEDAERPGPTGGRPQFSHPSEVNTVSQHSLDTLNAIAAKAGVDVNKMVVTSSIRNAADQARIMFEQIRSGDISPYKEPGRKVIALYYREIKAGVPPELVKAHMQQCIQEQYDKGILVSEHLGDQSKLNVFDIAPKSIPLSKRPAFEAALDEAEATGLIQKYHGPNAPKGVKDKAYHIEIVQPHN